MNVKSQNTAKPWIDPDDAPELTDDFLSKASGKWATNPFPVPKRSKKWPGAAAGQPAVVARSARRSASTLNSRCLQGDRRRLANAHECCAERAVAGAADVMTCFGQAKATDINQFGAILLVSNAASQFAHLTAGLSTKW